ncbi:hypothetical protein Y032_0027g1535 [Ancylostoma ceylanicum]|uniref:Uncharacterized protein n=1 Tax=Ancylostoma ceylanicum TaxID=53326 RepID=A0A016UU46_9BILA|nr:hypothetical protein Y032_0027g1535 [Ancylostoma ceylanicum]
MGQAYSSGYYSHFIRQRYFVKLGFVQQIANFRRKERDRGADTLVVRCPIRGSGKSRLIGFPQCLCPADPQPRCSRQLEWPRRGTAPCLRSFGSHYIRLVQQ